MVELGGFELPRLFWIRWAEFSTRLVYYSAIQKSIRARENLFSPTPRTLRMIPPSVGVDRCGRAQHPAALRAGRSAAFQLPHHLVVCVYQLVRVIGLRRHQPARAKRVLDRLLMPRLLLHIGEYAPVGWPST